MNCQSYKNQIDEAAFSDELNRHLAACSDCKTFREERECLHRLLEKLEYVNAPANFEFGVRAKLNSLPAANGGKRVWVRRFAFASPALAAVAVSAFVFSNFNATSPTDVEQTSFVAQNANAIGVPAATPAVSPTVEILAATNTNSLSNELVNKPAPGIINVGEQLAKRNPTPKKSSGTSNKSNEDKILSRMSDEPTLNRDEALTKAPRILPTGIDENPQKSIGAIEALSVFGIDLEINGNVKSVRNKIAANKIQAGDTIESINGQKPAAANLDTPLQQITVEVSRGGTKRKVTLNIKAN